MTTHPCPACAAVSSVVRPPYPAPLAQEGDDDVVGPRFAMFAPG